MWAIYKSKANSKLSYIGPNINQLATQYSHILSQNQAVGNRL